MNKVKELNELAQYLVDFWRKVDLRAEVLKKINSLSGCEAAYVAILMYGELDDEQATAFDKALTSTIIGI